MSVYVHTTVSHENEAEILTQRLLDAGFASRDVRVIQLRGQGVEHVPLMARPRVGPAALGGTVVGALLGALVFYTPALWFQQTPGLELTSFAVLGSVFGAIAGGVAGFGWFRTSPRFDRRSHAIAVGVHTAPARVAQASRALSDEGAHSEVIAGTEHDAAVRLRLAA